MKIKSLGEFINAIEKITDKWDLNYRTTTHPWYRGQGNTDWELMPSLYRVSSEISFERELSRDFMLKAGAFLEREPSNYVEWLYIMQHYGIPTRLLDWSESYLTALYFAVENFNTNIDCCVWIFDPWSLNEISLNAITVPTINHKTIRNYELKVVNDFLSRQVDAELPIAIRPKQNNIRINAQKGVFTIHGNIPIALNKMNPLNEIKIEKIEIDGNYKKDIYRELFKSGITPSVIFPELEGLAKEIRIRYSDEYINNKKNEQKLEIIK